MKSRFTYEAEYEPEDINKLFDVGVILGKKLWKLVTEGINEDEESSEDTTGNKEELTERVKQIDTRIDGIEAALKEIKEAIDSKKASKK